MIMSKLPREVSTCMKFTQYASIYLPLDHLYYLWLLLSFLPNKIENLSCCMSGGSVTSAHKGVGSGGGRWARD